jgi:protein DGCR14
MFSPDGVEDALETIAQRAQAESRAAPKSIVYENTRMPVPDKKPEASVPPSPSLSAVRDAIAGRSRPGYQDSTTGGGNETPRVNGYAFVDDEEPEEPSPAAPLIELGRGDATPNPFKLQESSKREELHRRMVERIAQSKRTSAKLGLTGKPDMTPVPKFPSSPRVTGGLTPAAQRLWSKIGSGGGTGSATPFDGRATPLRGKSSGLRTVTKRVS